MFNCCRVQDEVGRRHSAELRDLQERLNIEKQAWEENFMKKQVSVCVASLPGPRQLLISCSTGNWQKANEGSFGDKASAWPVCMQLCINRHCYLLCVCIHCYNIGSCNDDQGA